MSRRIQAGIGLVTFPFDADDATHDPCYDDCQLIQSNVGHAANAVLINTAITESGLYLFRLGYLSIAALGTGAYSVLTVKRNAAAADEAVLIAGSNSTCVWQEVLCRIQAGGRALLSNGGVVVPAGDFEVAILQRKRISR